MKKYLIICLLMFSASACKKDLPDNPSDFNVSVESTHINVGDTLNFNITGGDADGIVFYSGESGNNYDFVNRTSVAGIAKLVFQSSMQNGPAPPSPTKDSLKLLISPNLSGYDSASIVAANWTDITARNTKWPTVLSGAFTTSDSIDLTDFNTYDSINIAFRVLNKQNPTQFQRYWQIQGFSLYNILPEGAASALFSAPNTNNVASVSDFKYIGWVQASLLNNTDSGYNAWNVGTYNTSSTNTYKNSNGIIIRSVYPLTFNPNKKLNNPDNDDWLITSKVSLKQVKPDWGVAIKDMNDVPLTNYQKVFKKPGTYNVAFVAMNNNLNNSTRVVRRLQITVK